jgi:hypothetical protein
MKLLKKLFTKRWFLNSLRQTNKKIYNQKSLGKRDGQFIFFNETTYSSYTNMIFFLWFFLQNNKEVLILDTKTTYRQQFINSLFGEGQPQRIKKGQITNYGAIKLHFIRSEHKFITNLPQLLIVFDSNSNTDLIREANILKIPTICFYNKEKSYSNLYKISSNISFRFFYFVMYLLKNVFNRWI